MLAAAACDQRRGWGGASDRAWARRALARRLGRARRCTARPRPARTPCLNQLAQGRRAGGRRADPPDTGRAELPRVRVVPRPPRAPHQTATLGAPGATHSASNPLARRAPGRASGSARKSDAELGRTNLNGASAAARCARRGPEGGAGVNNRARPMLVGEPHGASHECARIRCSHLRTVAQCARPLRKTSINSDPPVASAHGALRLQLLRACAARSSRGSNSASVIMLLTDSESLPTPANADARPREHRCPVARASLAGGGGSERATASYLPSMSCSPFASPGSLRRSWTRRLRQVTLARYPALQAG